MGLEERGFAGSDLMAGRLPWDAEILHLEGFHLDFVGLNLVDSKGWPQIGVCLEGQDTSNKTWHSQLPFYPVLTPILVQGMDFFTFLFCSHTNLCRDAKVCHPGLFLSANQLR